MQDEDEDIRQEASRFPSQIPNNYKVYVKFCHYFFLCLKFFIEFSCRILPINWNWILLAIYYPNGIYYESSGKLILCCFFSLLLTWENFHVLVKLLTKPSNSFMHEILPQNQIVNRETLLNYKTFREMKHMLIRITMLSNNTKTFNTLVFDRIFMFQ